MRVAIPGWRRKFAMHDLQCSMDAAGRCAPASYTVAIPPRPISLTIRYAPTKESRPSSARGSEVMVVAGARTSPGVFAIQDPVDSRPGCTACGASARSEISASRAGHVGVLPVASVMGQLAGRSPAPPPDHDAASGPAPGRSPDLGLPRRAARRRRRDGLGVPAAPPRAERGAAWRSRSLREDQLALRSADDLDRVDARGDHPRVGSPHPRAAAVL